MFTRCLNLFGKLLLIAGMLSALASAEPGRALSHVSYIYPAGAQQGTEIELTAGGKGLRSVKEVYISGGGVEATVIHTVTNYKKNYGDLLRHQQRKIREKANEEKRKKNGDKKNPKKKPKTKDILDKEKKLEELPDHPIFRDLRNRSLEELAMLQKRYAKENFQKNRSDCG